MYNKDKQELYGTLSATYEGNTIIDNYLDRRDIMNTIVILMGSSSFRKCNKLLNNLSKQFDINQDWFNDIVRIFESATDKRERLTAQELRVYRNYCIINRIVLTH